MTILGLILFYKLIWDSDGSTYDGKFWKYLIAFVLTGLGIIFLLSAPISRIIFNKKINKFTVEKVNVICRKHLKEKSLSNIEKVIM